MKRTGSFLLLFPMTILLGLMFSGCYTQFAASNESPDPNQQEPIILYVPVPYPSPSPIPDPAPQPYYPSPLPSGSGGTPSGNTSETASPKREIGHSRVPISTPAQSSPDRSTGSIRRGR